MGEINKPKWDWEKVYLHGAHWEEIPSEVLDDFISMVEIGKVLDLGCGSGRDCERLNSLGFTCYGVDFSKAAIAKAKIRCDGCKFSVGFAEELPFEEEFFDSVYSYFVLDNVPLDKVPGEIAQVLKKGGIAYLAFLLNRVYPGTGEAYRFHSVQEILSAYSGFEVVRKREFSVEHDENGRKHMHDCFVLVLKK